MAQSVNELRAVYFTVPAENVDRVSEFLKEETIKQLVERWYYRKVTMVINVKTEKPAVAYDFVIRGGLEGGKQFARAFYERLSQFGEVYGGFIVQYCNGLD